jgi:UDP-N-acetylmuramate dehydrogenase
MIYDDIKKAAERLGARVLENAPLSELTTFRIGGPADLLITPADERSFAELYDMCTAARPFVIGRGSDLLFDDAGYRGVVISTASLDSIAVEDGMLTAGAGASISKCAAAACAEELSGLEFAYGIPGSVGGTVFMNAGAYGGCMADVVDAVTVYDAASRSRRVLPAAECAFGYRDSIFHHNRNLIVTGARFVLKRGDAAEIQKTMDANMRARREKQPLEYPSAGSAFKRTPGHYTAQLIDSCGLRGTRVGGAQVSEKHAGFIVNTGGATAADVLALMDLVKKTVLDRTGVAIEPEIIYVPAAE